VVSGSLKSDDNYLPRRHYVLINSSASFKATLPNLICEYGSLSVITSKARKKKQKYVSICVARYRLCRQSKYRLSPLKKFQCESNDRENRVNFEQVIKRQQNAYSTYSVAPQNQCIRYSAPRRIDRLKLLRRKKAEKCLREAKPERRYFAPWLAPSQPPCSFRIRIQSNLPSDTATRSSRMPFPT